MSRSEVDQLLRRVEAVDARQRRIGVEVTAFGRGAEDALDRVVEQAVVAALGFAQRLVASSRSRDVLDDALDRQSRCRPRRRARCRAPIPSASLPSRVLDAVLDLEARRAASAASIAVAHPRAVFGMRELLVRHASR